MPTTIDSGTAAIESRLKTALPTTPMHFPNAPFTPPVGTLWLDIDVLWGAGVLRSMKAEQRNAVIGVVHINIYTPENVGQGQARRMGDTLRGLFNRVSLTSATGEPLDFDVPSGLKGQRQETIAARVWDVASIDVGFQAEEVLS